MTHFKYEGNIDGISARQLEFISDILEERGYTNDKVFITDVGNVGDNYVTNVKRLTVERNEKTFKMIAKIAPKLENLRKTMNTALLFRNEHFMYTEVLPKFEKLQNDADVPEKEKLRYATCYGTLMDEPNEIILLEDLEESNFVILDRFLSLTDDSVRIVLKNLAILHSLSYGLKKLEPETYAAFRSNLLDMWSTLDRFPESKQYLQLIEKDMLEMLDNINNKRLIKETVSMLTTNSVKNDKIDTKSKYSVIQYGDSWTNSIMFVMKDGKAVDCCMIDYQVSKESSPVADLHYMIFNYTDYETRSKHYFEWIDYYHSELDKALSNFGLKVNFTYPRDQLDADLRRHGKLAFAKCLIVATVSLRESGEAAKVDTAMENVDSSDMENTAKAAQAAALDGETKLKYVAKIEGLLESFIEFGYFSL